MEENNEKEEFLDEKELGDSNLPPIKYIGVVFENKKVLTESGQPTFDLAKTHYTYKTREDYKQGQIITVPTRFGSSKAMVTDENLDPNTISYDLESILEI